MKKMLNKDYFDSTPTVFKNEEKGQSHVLTLSGVVSEPGLFDDQTINAKDIRHALDSVNKNIIIRLNSGGGDVFEGVEIYNYLKTLNKHVTIEVTALAASAASIIAMAADKITIRTGATMMIHEAMTFAIGNKNDIQKTLNALETIDTSLVDIYAERTEMDRDELSEMMTNETWFSASEAVKNGFADEKSSKKAVENKLSKGGDKMPKDKVAAALEVLKNHVNEDEGSEPGEPNEPGEPGEGEETLEEKIDNLTEKVDDIDERLKDVESDDSDDNDDDEGNGENAQNRKRKLYI